MARLLGIVIDCADPAALGRFWMHALGYVERPPPAGYASWAEHDAAVLGAVARVGFRPDSRWLATRAGIPVDQVNATLQRLLRKRKLRMGRERWHIQ